MNGELVPAAVLIPLLIGNSTDTDTGGFILDAKAGPLVLPPDTTVVFTERTHTVEHHKGQISFPGGVFEDADATLEQTALRESFEEIGLRPDCVEVVAELPEIPTVATRFRVKPFVGLVRQAPRFNPNPDEIGQIIIVPLSHLFNPTNSKLEYYERGGLRIAMRTYYYDQHRIWGATGRMLQTLLENLIQKR